MTKTLIPWLIAALIGVTLFAVVLSSCGSTSGNSGVDIDIDGPKKHKTSAPKNPKSFSGGSSGSKSKSRRR